MLNDARLFDGGGRGLGTRLICHIPVHNYVASNKTIVPGTIIGNESSETDDSELLV